MEHEISRNKADISSKNGPLPFVPVNMRPAYIENAVMASLRMDFCSGKGAVAPTAASASALNGFPSNPWQRLKNQKLDGCRFEEKSGSEAGSENATRNVPDNNSPWAGVLGIPALHRLDDVGKTDLCGKYAGRNGMEIVGQDMLTVEPLTSRISNVESCCKACSENALVCRSFTMKSGLCYLKTASKATSMRRSKDNTVLSAWRDVEPDDD